MRKLPLLYAAPYLFTFLAIFAALNPLWLREFPRLQLFDGELEFSEEKSFADLQTLVTHFPRLSAGSEANHASAQWMAERFRQMGMETKLESFEILAPEDIWHPAFLFQPIRSTHQQITGTNVLAFRQGRSPSVVLIMANRDGTRLDAHTAAGYASGNAVLLEMARVLTMEDHFYSFLFVSTDALEGGKQGAHFLAQSYPDLSLRLAISIDAVTGVDATTLRLSNPGNTRQSAPLWTVALAQQVMAHHGLDGVTTGSRWGMNNPVVLLYSFLQQRGLGSPRHTSTDVFLDRGDAVIGVATYSSHAVAGNNSRLLGSSEAMKPAALGMAGRFVERYVRSLELNQFDDLMVSRLYVARPGYYLPPASVRTASGLVLAAFACLIVLPFINPVVKRRNFVNYLERDLPWLADLVTLAILSGLVWLLPRLPWLRIFPPVVFMGVMIVIVLVGGIRIVRKRRYFLRLWHFEPTVANQRRILVLVLAALYIGYSLVLSPLSAAAMLFIPLLLWSAVRYRLPARRKLWAFVFGGWSVLHGLFSALFLAAVLTSTAPWSLTGLFAFTLISAQWLVILVYVFSTPPLGVIERR